ncbi:MAG: hypothetical protein HYX76_09195 [Acidobacteria bacterium]|nr:hypothetical protein [Acidobacteriota bacterium]
MFTITELLILLVGLFAFAAIARTAVAVFLKYRGTRIIVCPETHADAAVRVNVLNAAVATVLGLHDVRLKSCSRWPERQDCDQACLKQIEAVPEDCRLRTILDRWYAGKPCAFCGRPFGHIDWWDHKPALLAPGLKTVEWHEMPPEQVPLALTTHAPVCWNCHIVERFRREFPERVIERPPETLPPPARPEPEQNSKDKLHA